MISTFVRSRLALLCSAVGVLSVSMASVSVAQTAAPKDTVVEWKELSSQQGELRGKLPELLKSAIDSARKQKRTLFVEVGATWCGPCLELEANLKKPEMVDAFSGTSILHLDANEWDVEDDMGPLGIKGGVMPLFIAFDTAMKATSQLTGTIDAPGLKKFLQANRWPETLKGSPATLISADEKKH